MAPYAILDIRHNDGSATCFTEASKKAQDQQEAARVPRPPSPPASHHPSVEDAFNSADLVDTILDGLSQPTQQKSVPTYVLYDTMGLQLFDKITYLDDYYLTNAELSILRDQADNIADRVQDGTVIIELGAGSLRKTELILQAMEQKQRHVTYFALDLDQQELERSLSSLGRGYRYVKLMGLLGTYDQGLDWCSKQYTSQKVPKLVLWLGSSIGNQTRYESAVFLNKLQRMCLQPGDLCVIGFDQRNDPAVVARAYDDSEGVTREFILNGLDHVNAILGQPLLNRADFDYDSQYQHGHGRHVAHYRAKKDLVLRYTGNQGSQKNDGVIVIKIQQDERIHVEHSYKYSQAEMMHILNAAELNLVERWVDAQDRYSLVLAECRPFYFEIDKEATLASLLGTASYQDEDRHAPIGCTTCDQAVIMSATEKQDQLTNFMPSTQWPASLPTLHEWEQLWTSWDVVTRTMLHHPTMLFERPISLRHPFIFYLGHIPAFLDIMMTRHGADDELGTAVLTEPTEFADIFERGIDPDMEDPSICNPHSEVPEHEKDWPKVARILDYQHRVRHRVRKLLLHWEAESYKSADAAWLISSRQRPARVMWMCFEHEAMHIETLLYMLLQSPNVRAPPVSPPAWAIKTSKEAHVDTHPLAPAPLVTFTATDMVATLGHDDDEALDGQQDALTLEFGWDNEHPRRKVPVAPFEIQSRPVTNGEYWAFVNQQPENERGALWPAAWTAMDSDIPKIKTSFGLADLAVARHWPAQVSYIQADAYALAHGMRLPTEEEWQYLRADADAKHTRAPSNVGFHAWTPLPVANDNRIHIVGHVFEWTSTIMDAVPGYKPSELYPGYSADFLDGKHRVVLGGSWATHPRMAERPAFKNWYQSGYPYVFSGFRLCRSIA
ncbi:hypothetical protein BC940DRAFT_330631 [Gongronella butleri]|nr:hypothetical protein BC940DRAFT_330631 [Gongronella butleri]